jgi:hypothetical protein
MSSYKDAVAYFKGLSVANTDILHLDENGKKKFFRMDLEEFWSGTVAQLPAPSAGPFMVLFNYIIDYSKPDQPNKKKQFLFMILQGHPKDDFTAEEKATDLTENVMEEIVKKINYDAPTNDFLRWGFEFNSIRCVPVKYANATGKYVGWQCSFFLNERISACIDPAKWTGGQAPDEEEENNEETTDAP